MAKIKTIYYVCGVIHSQGRILVVRPLAYNHRPYTPFFFPGTKLRKLKDEVAVLASAIKGKYKGEISVDTFMGESVREVLNTRFVLRAYYCSLEKNFFLPRSRIDYRWASDEELKDLRLDPNDREIADRYQVFKRVYDGEHRDGGRDDKESAEVWFYLDSFAYFKNRLNNKDVADFNDLARTIASIADLRKAYKLVMRLNDVDYNEFIDYHAKINEPKDAIKYRPTSDELDIPDRPSMQRPSGDSIELLDARHPEAEMRLDAGATKCLSRVQVVGIVILSTGLLVEIATLVIAVVPFIPNFYSTVLGTILLIVSSLMFLTGVMLAFYARKEG